MKIESKIYVIGGLGLLGGVILGSLLGTIGFSKPVIMSPAGDNKIEQAYRRSGFGDRLMSVERRKKFSTCYKLMLSANGYDEINPTPKPGDTSDAATNAYEGKVTFVFHLAEDGRLIDFEHVDSEISDKNFIRCLTKAIEGTRFLPPPLGVNRYLAYDLVFKSDETYKREIEERKNQAPLLLVTPTPGGASDASSQPPPPPPPPPPPTTPSSRPSIPQTPSRP
jgi:hypothetical protein